MDAATGGNIWIYGITRNFLLLFSVPLDVVTVTKPVVAPLGTIAVTYVLDLTDDVASSPLKETVVVDVKFCPRNSTVLPTLPALGSILTYARRWAFKP